MATLYDGKGKVLIEDGAFLTDRYALQSHLKLRGLSTMLETANFDEATIVDRPETRWSPYHGRQMRARVAETILRGQTIWNGTQVTGKPGDGQFVKRQSA